MKWLNTVIDFTEIMIKCFTTGWSQQYNIRREKMLESDPWGKCLKLEELLILSLHSLQLPVRTNKHTCTVYWSERPETINAQQDTFKLMVKKCKKATLDLLSKHFFHPNSRKKINYNVLDEINSFYTFSKLNSYNSFLDNLTIFDICLIKAFIKKWHLKLTSIKFIYNQTHI